MTPTQLSRKLYDLGHPVSLRRLIDWRAKGLLPPLSRHGRGRGSGAMNVWEHVDILDQAVTVHELLARHARAETALLGTWFAGYEVDVGRVRDAWTSRLNRTVIRVRLSAGPYGDIEDVLGNWSPAIAKKFAREYGLPYEEVDALLLEVLNALFDPSYIFDVDENLQLVETAKHILSKIVRDSNLQNSLNKALLQGIFNVVQGNFSIYNILNLIVSSTDEDLISAHRQWRGIINIVRRLATMASPADFPGKWLAITFGAPCILILLWLGKRAVASKVDATIETAVQFLDSIPNEQWASMRSQLASGIVNNFQLPPILDQLTEIWADFNVWQLCSLNAPER